MCWAFFHTDEIINGARRERGILYTIGPDGRVVSRAEGYGNELAADGFLLRRSDASTSTCMCGCTCPIRGG